MVYGTRVLDDSVLFNPWAVIYYLFYGNTIRLLYEGKNGIRMAEKIQSMLTICYYIVNLLPVQ